MTYSLRIIAILQLILSAVLWSLGGILIKLADWNPLAIAGGRSAVAGLVLGLWFYRGRAIPLSRSALGGAVAYSLVVVTFVAATRLTAAANAIALQYTAPVYVLIFGWWFLGEKARWYDWIGVGLTLCGVALFFCDQITTGGMAGNVLGLLSGVAFAALVMLLRLQKDAEPLDSVLLGNILTALVGLPAMLASVPTPQTLLIIIVMGIVQLALPYVLFTKAIKHVSALEGLLIPIIEPIFNPLWVLLFLGEMPGRSALFGAAIIVFAVTARSIAEQKTPERAGFPPD